MTQIPKGRLVKDSYTPICSDCAMYFVITVPGFEESLKSWKE